MAVVSSGSPLTARRKLGSELRILRDRAGLTTEEVGAHLNCHNSKVSRIELAKRMCTRKDFAGLMELYEVDGEKRAELEELMTRAMQRIPPWWDAYADVISANYAEFLAYEAEATCCCEYQPLLIPGPLQTAEYAHAVTGVSFTALGPDQVESLVEVRMRRQERLRDDVPMLFEAVVTEAALRLRVGGTQVMRGQLRRLREAASLDNVKFRVIPFDAGEKAASTGAFTLFGIGKDTSTDVAFTESADNTTNFRDDPLALRRMNRLFRNLSAAAQSEEDSVELVGRIEKELV
ncbi:helix-turn-helix domain-containing protein [Streptomyces boncukensis]|uniref:Helix-turn-helix domain-containing protein n=1 Tax=Streptomyces boncukensis TaxID=2711219 RepID=A0A6G4WUB5_9ACTN|nr:helix-turn-helix transcriptional regulator [Streptomyces boncukensis]NGO68217.1 helix-turn-helix domain-containing protein [Streptomyces boncukensis]